MKDTLIRNLLGVGADRVCLESNIGENLIQTKHSLEALGNLLALNEYIKTNINNPTDQVVTLANIAIESICNQAKVNTPNISFEDLDQQNIQMTSTEDILKDSLINKLSSLIPELYSDITNLSVMSNEFENKLTSIENMVKEIPLDKMPLIENLKPLQEYIYLYTADGLDLNATINTPTKLYNELISKIDTVTSDLLNWGFNEYSIRQTFVSADFDLTNILSELNNINFPNLPGLMDLKVTSDSNDLNIQLIKSSNGSNIELEINTQSSMSEEQWLEFNKNGRSENDNTVLKMPNINDMNILIDKLRSLNKYFIKNRVEFNNKIFINKEETIYSKDPINKFNFIIDRIQQHFINYKDSNINDKSYVIADKLLTILILRNKIDQSITKYCFDLINSLYQLLNRSISFYNY